MELIDHKPIRQVGPDSVVDELMECLKLWETGKEDVLMISRVGGAAAGVCFGDGATQVIPPVENVNGSCCARSAVRLGHTDAFAIVGIAIRAAGHSTGGDYSILRIIGVSVHGIRRGISR